MIIRGNTAGSYVPRADYAVTDPKSPSFIKNKPDEAIKQATDAATAAKTAANEAKTAAQTTANNALPKSGGTVNGMLVVDGAFVLVRGKGFGLLSERPADAVEGQVYLRIPE